MLLTLYAITVEIWQEIIETTEKFVKNRIISQKYRKENVRNPLIWQKYCEEI